MLPALVPERDRLTMNTLEGNQAFGFHLLEQDLDYVLKVLGSRRGPCSWRFGRGNIHGQRISGTRRAFTSLGLPPYKKPENREGKLKVLDICSNVIG